MDMKKAAEIVIIGGVLVLAANNVAHASPIPASTTGSQNVAVATDTFVTQAFTIGVSNYVALTYIDNTTQANLTSASTRGEHTFGGNTNGISPTQCEAASQATPVPSTPAATSTNGCT
jgi:hypothetical protein